MLPGPTIIRRCSACGNPIAQGTLASWNTFGARFWTDGKMEAPMKVTAVERPRFVEAKTSGSMAATVRLRLEPAAGGTDVTAESEYEMPLGFIGDAANKLFVERSMADSWDKSLAKFKALAEAEAPAHL